jgi:hypothetical protein
MKASLHLQVHPNSLSLSLSLSLLIMGCKRTYFYGDFYLKDTQMELGIPPQGRSAVLGPRRKETGAS